VLPFRLPDVRRVEFYKRDELTTDLICCEVTVGDVVHFSHEEASDWGELVEALQALPKFDRSWFSRVGEPPFAECRTCAFERS
jgi:hypothetical protein